MKVRLNGEGKGKAAMKEDFEWENSLVGKQFLKYIGRGEESEKEL